jgi:asparagine synthase (glutamine-hydrolysing)
LVASTGKPRGWHPSRTERGDIVLFHGWIDNRSDTREALGPKFPSDAALYAAAYDAWGDAADLRLIGEYAAILVHPDENRLRLSRSPLRAPPLHFYLDRDRTIVATTPRTIFATGDVAQEIDEQKIADSLFLNYTEGGRGWFKGVRRVGLGSRVVITPGRVEATTFYDPLDCPNVRFARDAEYVEAANALMHEATLAALDGYRQPAVSLSGGYDSQAVAAFAMAARPGTPVYGYTGVPEAGWDGVAPESRFGDERAHVEALSHMHPQLVTEWVDAAGKSFDHHLQGMFLLGSVAPRNTMNLHWIHEIHARAKARGCDVLLTGSLGNATFSFAGDGMIADLFRRGRWIQAANEVRGSRGKRSFARAFISGAIMPNLPGPLWQGIHKLVHRKEINVFEAWCPMNPEWAAEMRVAERALDMGYDQNYQPPRSTRDWRGKVLGNAMNEGGDIHQAFDILHGIPTRDPTAYRPLVEFCMGIPDDQYMRNGQRRWLARRMLKDQVPDMVLSERRRGLQAADWHLRIARQKDELISEIDRLAQDPAMTRRLNLASLRSALVEMTDTAPPESEKRQRLQLAISRGLTTARFIRYVEGRNDG